MHHSIGPGSVSRLTLLSVVVGLVGCGSSTTPAAGDAGVTDSSVVDGGDAGPAEDAPPAAPTRDEVIAAFCEIVCARADRCEADEAEEANGACRASCAEDAGRRYTRVRLDFVAAYGECLRELACGMIDDVCGVRASAAIDVTEEGRWGAVECASTAVSCGGDLVFPDLCDAFTVLEPDTTAEAVACLDLPCPEISDCLVAVFGAAAPPEAEAPR